MKTKYTYNMIRSVKKFKKKLNGRKIINKTLIYQKDVQLCVLSTFYLPVIWLAIICFPFFPHVT